MRFLARFWRLTDGLRFLSFILLLGDARRVGWGDSGMRGPGCLGAAINGGFRGGRYDGFVEGSGTLLLRRRKDRRFNLRMHSAVVASDGTSYSARVEGET